jgi:hypothetical protein
MQQTPIATSHKEVLQLNEEVGSLRDLSINKSNIKQ